MDEFKSKLRNFLQDAFYEKLGNVMVEEGAVTVDEETQKEIDDALRDYAYEIEDQISGIAYDFYDSLFSFLDDEE